NDVPEPPDDALADLPDHVALDLPGGQLVVLHGHQVLPARTRHAQLRKRFAGARAVFYGHTHRAVIDRSAAPWILNAGAGGRTRTFGGPSCIELIAGQREWRATLTRFPPLLR